MGDALDDRQAEADACVATANSFGAAKKRLGDADREAGRKIRCPLLVEWSTRDDMEELYGDVVAVWRAWADDVRGIAIDSGHHVAEEAPGELAAALLDFV